MTTSTANETLAKITRILGDAKVEFNAAYLGERNNAMDSGRPMDAWDCKLSRGTFVFQFDFFTGIGMRKLPEWRGPGPAPSPRCIAGADRIKQAKPQAPHAAELLHCLLADASACEQSFESWCGEIGYDADSRKAHATYLACQENGDKLRKVFNAEQIRQISEALADY